MPAFFRQLLTNAPFILTGAIVTFCFRDLISSSDVWLTSGFGFSLTGVFAVWPVYVFTVIVNLINIALNGMKDKGNSIWQNFRERSWSSLKAGLFEEVLCRWLLCVVLLFPLMAIRNPLKSGLGSLYLDFLAPAVNTITFGLLEPQLFHPSGWQFGVTMLLANTVFAVMHYESGWATVVNAWIVGLPLFWVMFNYGLLTAIVVHALIDLIIDVAEATLLWVNRRHQPAIMAGIRQKKQAVRT